jgi:hypothetical protein
VIQRLNSADWPNIVTTARAIGLDQISFLAADLSTPAFNRGAAWDDRRRAEVQPSPHELADLTASLETLISERTGDFASGFIAESPDVLRRIPAYYSATHGRGDFPPVACTAPWVSAVIEADGTVRPCFFHSAYGNLRETGLVELINSAKAVGFRRQLDVSTNPVCRRCVCTLDLRPTVLGRPLLSPRRRS